MEIPLGGPRIIEAFTPRSFRRMASGAWGADLGAITTCVFGSFAAISVASAAGVLFPRVGCA